MGEELDPTSHDTRDDDEDDDDYDEGGGGNRLLGFMFGNVDGSGDLDVDYLDEDAKEHLAALADKLGSSLTEIDLSTKSSQTLADASEQDYDAKAEDAVDYEDIEEQYEGPEIQATSEEDHLLPKKEYFSAEVSLANLDNKNSIFGEENYDEDEDLVEENLITENMPKAQGTSSAGTLKLEHGSRHPCNFAVDKNLKSSPEKGTFNLEQASEHLCDLSMEQNLRPSSEKDEKSGLYSSQEESDNNVPSFPTLEARKVAVVLDNFQEEPEDLEDLSDEKESTSLPILFIEDGKVVLRFSEIFGAHEPLRKRDKRNYRYPIPKEKYRALDASDAVEEDEEAFLRGSCTTFFTTKQESLTQCDNGMMDTDVPSMIVNICQKDFIEPTLVGEGRKDFCFSAQPMKESVVDLDKPWGSLSCPRFYPLDQQDWEDNIIWDDSPRASHETFETCVIFGAESEDFTPREKELEIRPQNFVAEAVMDIEEMDQSLFLRRCPLLLEAFDSRKVSDAFAEMNHPQLLRLESRLKVDNLNYSEVRKENSTGHLNRDNAMKKFDILSKRNMDLLEGSWLHKIIWEPDQLISKSKLILDLQDEQMLFEALETKEGRQLRSHAGAMIITRSAKANTGDSFDLSAQGLAFSSRFNISNDKYYSNRKMSQQVKSHSKKRAAHGVKVLHSMPALRLQTMKPKLSNKDIANFHRPKALWYPHDNEVAAKEQGKLSTHGPMKLILKSLGGKGSKLHVDAEESVSSLKTKASKKLDFKPSEKVKIIYSGKELEDIGSLEAQNVRPNSLLHLVRTKIHLWPRAQKLPGENKSLRPPGAFRKKSDLSVKDGHVLLMEYCEERPLLLGNIGMGARLCTYYSKSGPADQTVSSLRSGSSFSLGTILTLDSADKSPFLGDIRPGCSQSCLETNMYRAPIFPHRLPSTDYLLVRSAKGKLSLRRIDRIDVVGQQEPHMEVIAPGTKNLQTYIGNMLLVYTYREFRANEKHGLLPCLRADELSSQFPNLTEPFLRKRLKHCADLQRDSSGLLFWVMRRNFRIPLEEELRRMVAPENVCAYESMQAGFYRLKRLGIGRLTQTTGLSSAMNQLPDEAIALAAASHIERELLITPWNLSSNFVACTNQDRENIERLEITGVGDPSGRGLGFSYVRVAPKAPMSSAVMKKKPASVKAGSTVTGTDADLRRLSMEAAREVLLKFNVPEEQIARQTRWHRIAMIRKLSSEQAASGVKVDPTTISKYARGQRMSFLQLQQQTREKCQEIWDRQVQSLSAADGDENESDSEANSDLDSFAGDLENLLDAEECGEGDEGNCDFKHDKVDGVRGLKMRRHPSQAQAEEEIEDEAAEAAELCRMLMDDDEAQRRKKQTAGSGIKKEVGLGWQSGFGSEIAEQKKKTNTILKQIICIDGSVTSNTVGGVLTNRTFPGKVKGKMAKNEIMQAGSQKAKTKTIGYGFKVIKEKKSDKPVREGYVCGACGQMGHMRTNKNCPRYGDELDVQVETTNSEKLSGSHNFLDPSTQIQQKYPIKKGTNKGAMKISLLETSENSERGPKKKISQLKVKCAPSTESFDKQVVVDLETGVKPAPKISKIIISSKIKPEDVQVETLKPSIVIRPPTHKIVIKQPKGIVNVDYVKQPKMIELSSFENNRKYENKQVTEAAAKRKAIEEMRLWEEEEKRRKAEIRRVERERLYEEQKFVQAEQQRFADSRRYDVMHRSEQFELPKVKNNNKKKKKTEYLDDEWSIQDERRMPGSRAAKRRSVIELGRNGAEYAQQSKRRRGGEGEVGLANILENIADRLKDQYNISYLFLKPVSKKDAPDYLDIVKHPMDLSTIKDKARRMQYKNREDFRHDVWQIAYNAHAYNDGRHPLIPPLADQLLELCDYMLIQNDEPLAEAESGIQTDRI